jgi:hypothetical protein
MALCGSELINSLIPAKPVLECLYRGAGIQNLLILH